MNRFQGYLKEGKKEGEGIYIYTVNKIIFN